MQQRKFVAKKFVFENNLLSKTIFVNKKIDKNNVGKKIAKKKIYANKKFHKKMVAKKKLPRDCLYKKNFVQRKLFLQFFFFSKTMSAENKPSFCSGSCDDNDNNNKAFLKDFWYALNFLETVSKHSSNLLNFFETPLKLSWNTL